MQGREEISSVEVIGRDHYEDRTHPISCSAAGDSSSDRMLSEAVIGRTDFTVYRCGNINEDRTQQLWMTGCARQWCPIDSREVPERRKRDHTCLVANDWTQH
jgi:hypothetical protein